MLLRTRAEAKFRKATNQVEDVAILLVLRDSQRMFQIGSCGGVTGCSDRDWWEGRARFARSSGSARGRRGNKEMERSWFSWVMGVSVGSEVVFSR